MPDLSLFRGFRLLGMAAYPKLGYMNHGGLAR
jgi:hypothetical protein